MSVDTKREYMDRHSHINFQFDINCLPARVWQLLGQIEAKCDQISGIPLSPKIADRMYLVYLAKGAQATVAIEGNTLTEAEVQQLVPEGGTLDLPPSLEYLEKEAKNIINACNIVKDYVLEKKDNNSVALTVEEIQKLHEMVLSDLPLRQDVERGEFRTYPAGVGSYAGAPAQDIPYLTNLLCKWMNRNLQVPENSRIPIGIVKAILAHLYIEWIHPFGDGNGRTGRMLEFRLLLAAGLPTVAAHLLTNHYNMTRSEYYRHLDMSSKLQDDAGVYLFLEYALQGFRDQLNRQIAYVEEQQLKMSWQSYVNEVFGEYPTEREIRQKQLLFDLSEHDKPVPLNNLRHVSPRVAEAYATLADKTFRRDVRDLGHMDLLKLKDDGIVANRDLMRAFLPQRREVNQLTDITE
jgi:Fic family protein